MEKFVIWGIKTALAILTFVKCKYVSRRQSACVFYFNTPQKQTNLSFYNNMRKANTSRMH